MEEQKEMALSAGENIAVPLDWNHGTRGNLYLKMVLMQLKLNEYEDKIRSLQSICKSYMAIIKALGKEEDENEEEIELAEGKSLELPVNWGDSS